MSSCAWLPLVLFNRHRFLGFSRKRLPMADYYLVLNIKKTVSLWSYRVQNIQIPPQTWPYIRTDEEESPSLLSTVPFFCSSRKKVACFPLSISAILLAHESDCAFWLARKGVNGRMVRVIEKQEGVAGWRLRTTSRVILALLQGNHKLPVLTLNLYLTGSRDLRVIAR